MKSYPVKSKKISGSEQTRVSYAAEVKKESTEKFPMHIAIRSSVIQAREISVEERRERESHPRELR